MSPQFDWQTDEEGEWEPIATPGSDVDSTTPISDWSLNPRLTLVFMFLVLGAVILLIRRQVLLAEAEVRAAVLAANTLAVEAAYAGDADLFRTLISGRDETWTDTQIVLAGQELALSNSARLFGLEPRPGDVDLQIVAISPDLNEVEIEMIQRYQPAGPRAANGPVTLSQTLIYRRGSVRWLLAPPEDKSAFWGSFQSLTGRYLTILYPERDAELVQRMATDIEADLTTVCTRLPADCPDDWHIVLRLERNPASLLSMAGQKYLMDIGPSVVMPTPSLVGRPVDETSYEHLYRAYATYIVSLTLTRVVEYECCHHAAFYTAMLDWFMANENLVQWPLAGYNYATTLHFPISLDNLESLYQRSDFRFMTTYDRRMVHAFVEFMLVKAAGKGELTPDLASFPAMIDRLALHNGFWGWVNSMSDYNSRDQELLIQDWLRFIDGRHAPNLLAEQRSTPDIWH